MRHALELMYIDILEFHQHAMRFFSGKGIYSGLLAIMKLIFASMEAIFSVYVERLRNQIQRYSKKPP